jgi:hypothetical protein
MAAPSPPAKNPMKALVRRLKSIHIPEGYLRSVVLPEWWNDEAALNPTGYAEALGYVARHLRLDLGKLQNEDAPLGFVPLPKAKFKLRRDTTQAQVFPTAALAFRAVRTALDAFNGTLEPIPSTASETRKQILSSSQSYISLNNLLDWCWQKGLPVVHVSSLPKTAKVKKMDGIAVNDDGRFAIALCSGHRQSAWLLFHLAHELGHISLGHVSEPGVLFDQDTRDDKQDSEKDATQFALELVNGSAGVSFKAPRWLRARDLASAARDAGRQFGVDPGAVALNYAWNSEEQQFAAANAALGLLEPDADAPALVRQKMLDHLDLSLLPEETAAWLLRITTPSDSR